MISPRGLISTYTHNFLDGYCSTVHTRMCHMMSPRGLMSTYTHMCRMMSLTGSGWRKYIECFIFIGHFLQKSPMISGSCAERDLQLKDLRRPFCFCLVAYAAIRDIKTVDTCQNYRVLSKLYVCHLVKTLYMTSRHYIPRPPDPISHVCSLTGK